ENGLKHGAIGYLITDWGDRGHWQPLPVSYLGFAYGTGVSWGLDANRELDMSTILDLYAFQDEAHLAGNVAMDLGRVHERLNMLLPNSTILFHLLQSSLEEIAQYKDELPARTEELKQVVQQIEEIEAHLNDLKIQRSDAALLKGEFAWICGMLKHACWRGIWAAGKLTGKEDQVLREQLFEDAGLLMKEHENIWLARNRPGGLKDSLARLKKMRESYR
ncbi:MAG: glycoside hydrolase, partial [Anaerolineales bacterium]